MEKAMIAFEVNDMTCGHCVSTITKAVKAADKDATVQIDLATRRVEIEPGEADAQAIGDAIKEAGYTPVPASAAPAADAAKQGGCCR
jgi:copper chaperone